MLLYTHVCCISLQGCGNIEPTTGHFDLFSPLLSCSPYTLYAIHFQFTGHSIDLSDNVLHDWLFPYHCITYFLPPTRTFIVNLLSGASSPISILAAMIALVEEGGMNSPPGDANTGGSKI